MHASKNVVVGYNAGRPIVADIFYTPGGPKPVVIYAHGFNGFKDWASFDIIATQFAEANTCFIKFNFSHNGTSPQSPELFVDTEAYGQNNYTKELTDLQAVIDWALRIENPHRDAIDVNRVFVIGHSRGGGIVLLKAAEEPRVKAVATWASVAECKTPWGSWPADRLSRWKESGTEYYTNSRTGQKLPLYYQLHEDFLQNSHRLDIIKKLEGLRIPLLICHGINDEAVPVEKAHALKAVAKEVELFLVDSDHVFGRKHPWPHQHLPQPMQDVVNKTIAFFKTIG